MPSYSNTLKDLNYTQVRIDLFIETNKKILRLKDSNKYIANTYTASLFPVGCGYLVVDTRRPRLTVEHVLLPWFKQHISITSIYDLHLDCSLK